MRKKNPEGNPVGKPIGTERARELAAMRVHKRGGHPLSDKLRCPCGAMTLHTALNRRHDCEEPEPKRRKQKPWPPR